MAKKAAKNWYVVRTLSGKEKKAQEYILSEVNKRGWQDKVTRVIIPTEKVISMRNGKKVVKDRNFFPGYVLVEAVLEDDIVPAIQNVPNVMDWLREGTSTAPIPMEKAEIDRILGKMDEQKDTEGYLADNYVVGETVKVIDGAFASFTGMVEEVNDDKKKLKVTVKIFGRKTPLELSYSQVEKDDGEVSEEKV